MRFDKADEQLVADFDKLFKELETEKAICQEIQKTFGKIIKIRRIYIKPKGSRYEYYQITFERG